MPKEFLSIKVLIALTLLGGVLTIEFCGHSQNILRIVGGNETKPLEYPWMAFMRITYLFNSTHRVSHIVKCDASLIDDQWLVSAAHCFGNQMNSTIASVHLKLGAHNITKHESMQLELESKQYFVHPLYEHKVGSKHDITLVKLSEKLDFKEKHRHLQPICLPQKDLPVNASDCRITGWGRTSNLLSNDSDVLREAKVNLISSTECKKVRTEIDESEVCAGYTGVSTCRGDSGGPLQCPLANGVWLLEGITSYGRTVCGSNIPSVFTKVETYLDWINNIRKNH